MTKPCTTAQIYQEKAILRSKSDELTNAMNDYKSVSVQNNHDGTMCCVAGSLDVIESALMDGIKKITDGMIQCPLNLLYHTLPLSSNQYVVRL